MKHLLLMRHSKSAWDEPNITDFDRSLNERGRKDAPEMGSRIKHYPFKPDLIISSPAKRAIKTAKTVAEVLHYPEKKIELESDIYEATIEDVCRIIRQVEDNVNSLMIVGHNPTFTGMIGYLTHHFIDNLPTSGVALIELNIDTWKQLKANSGKLLWLDYPKSKQA
jgi:phosphohistidine phosphatase